MSEILYDSAYTEIMNGLAAILVYSALYLVWCAKYFTDTDQTLVERLREMAIRIASRDDRWPKGGRAMLRSHSTRQRRANELYPAATLVAHT